MPSSIANAMCRRKETTRDAKRKKTPDCAIDGPKQVKTLSLNAIGGRVLKYIYGKGLRWDDEEGSLVYAVADREQDHNFGC